MIDARSRGKGGRATDSGFVDGMVSYLQNEDGLACSETAIFPSTALLQVATHPHSTPTPTKRYPTLPPP